jgi:cytochrome c
MKKSFLVLFIAAGIYACGGSVESEKKPISNNEENRNSQIGGETTTPAVSAPPSVQPVTDTAAKPVAVVEQPAGKDGSKLIEGSDCRTCHKNDVKLIGPAYKDVAKKYPSNEKNIKLLADKIINGGQGVWGEIPMAAHPNISKEDAEAMVKYILTIK